VPLTKRFSTLCLLAAIACGSSSSGGGAGATSDAGGADASDAGHDAACVYPSPNMGFAGSPCCPAMGASGQCWSGGYCNIVSGLCCWRMDSGRRCNGDNGACCSGTCAADGVCTACIDPGGACGDEVPCCSGVCAGGVCR
jgi:hypothetical protein